MGQLHLLCFITSVASDCVPDSRGAGGDLSKWGPQISSISWELAGSADSQGLPHPQNQKTPEVGPSALQKSPRHNHEHAEVWEPLVQNKHPQLRQPQKEF